ncbi:MAG: hypothetical protein JEZ07_20345 [Phycisphaerae bacterium]|nr:hypothetical protein [Phycisphaerae bacterium]
MNEMPEMERLENVLHFSRIVAGGFLGQDGRDVEEIIRQDSAGADFTGWYSVGGFGGRNTSSGTMENCFCAVDTVAAIGGFCGTYGTATTSDCFWDSDTSGIVAANAPATAKTTAQLMKVATFTNWDFTLPRDWKIIEDYSYPALDWE